MGISREGWGLRDGTPFEQGKTPTNKENASKQEKTPFEQGKFEQGKTPPNKETPFRARETPFNKQEKYFSGKETPFKQGVSSDQM